MPAAVRKAFLYARHIQTGGTVNWRTGECVRPRRDD